MASPDANTMYTLTTEDLGKRFGRSWVFRGLTMSVNGGESVAITGRNGSGKSTLLRILSGLLRPTLGKIALTRDGVGLEPQEHIHTIGYVAPNLNFYKKMSAVENLLFVARMRGLPTTEVDIVALLDRVGLPRRGGDLVGSFSSGMQQRLRVATLLIHRPPVVLLDEPFSNLDAEGILIVKSMMSDQIESGGIVVLATNSSDEAALCGFSVAIPEIH